MTSSDLIEIIARVIGEHDAPDYVPDQWREEAATILSALSAARDMLLGVPREAIRTITDYVHGPFLVNRNLNRSRLTLIARGACNAQAF